MSSQTIKISIKKNNQQYLSKIIKKFPKINSGRKNYKGQYIRVLKNLLLTQAYKIILKKKIEFLHSKISFKENNKYITIKFTV